MYLTSINTDSHGYYGWMAECDTDAPHGVMGEEHITRRYPRKRSAGDRIRTIAHILDWQVDFTRTEDKCI